MSEQWLQPESSKRGIISAFLGEI
ncbi:hypothetical protein Goarm_020096 [Gossypium armourianum]|uniref:Uncharacterized protein n=1 Tax=Gossypium armourianum TaxID=34283 RepID=A0A7J9IMK8_9ROSI|nr:hypothetical protein [Gossypium armourianum]